MRSVRSLIVFLMLASACAPASLQGEERHGILMSDGGGHYSFISETDGHVYTLDAGHAWPGESPLCISVDSSIEAEWAMIVHRVLNTERYLDRNGAPSCTIATARRYTGVLEFPSEGVDYYTNESGKRPWFPIELDGDSNFREYRTSERLQWLPRFCLEVEGALSQEGSFNHIGRSKHQFTVLRVIGLKPMPPVQISGPRAPLDMSVRPEHIAACATGIE